MKERKKDNKLSYWYIVMFFLLISAFFYIKDLRQSNIEKDIHLSKCNVNMSDYAKCKILALQIYEIEKEQQKMSEPNIFKYFRFLRNLILSLILFYIVRYLIHDKK